LPGGYIRTNFRRTGSLAGNLDVIGGAYPKSSQTTMGKTAGAGTKDGYGGFIWLSWTGAIMQATNDASLAGISSRWVDSTYGLMQSYYGNGNFDSGYAFLPVIAYAMSATGINYTAGGIAGTILGFWMQMASFRNSGSYAIFTPLLICEDSGAASVVSFVSLSGAAVDLQIGGFIVSTP